MRVRHLRSACIGVNELGCCALVDVLTVRRAEVLVLYITEQTLVEASSFSNAKC